ncbi:monomeric thiosulfate reductase apoprotein [Desulfonauticus submarinus]|uniref:Monomeric thiosulfate reductase apoprotein n=1 Tax=Desulfonauticus submarinus TaxID=206665 RepID=A0A1H0GG69_9BACT|nr:molybdopterin-dependent oxidoreductase [Desulfonauticus submarinus]SDO05884.1 monomeric thiosulfate reductase apoprotein [Desulfonauticus submarinus]
MKEKKYSICGMCTSRCPIEVDVEDGEIKFIQGNRQSGVRGGLCARGAAGTALIEDAERPQYPLIREGARGEGKWRKVSWEEAFAYVAERLKEVIDKYGTKSVLWSDRGGPFADLHKAFVRAIGSPNYCNHDASCARNVQHAALSLFGFGRKGVVYDFKNAKHVVLQTRNLFEAINVSECVGMMDALEKGCKLTVIDVRATITAGKADTFFMIRPGTDYAFNLAVINEILRKKLYDSHYVNKYFEGLSELRSFVEPYTPEWAEEETGIPAKALRNFVQELAAASPSVIWHPGWNNARYTDSFYVSRTIYIINALLGSIGAKGGLAWAMTPKDCGKQGLNSLAAQFPKPEEKRADGVGWKYKYFDAGPGLLHLAFKAIETEDPYPLKAYICYRHDPLMAFPDPNQLKKILDKLDFLVSVTFSWSETAWYADVVLPLSPYLERESIIATKKGPKPHFIVRQRCVEPRFDTKADWEIICGLAKAMGIEKLSFDSIEDIWNFQLNGTGVKIEDFNKNGMVMLTDTPLYIDRENLKFKTQSGKIEIIAPKWEEAGVPSLKPYEPKPHPEEGSFRLTVGRCAIHTQGHTINNALLVEQMPENVLWINRDVAKSMGIEDGDIVEVDANNGYKGKMRAFVTPFIHPEAVFMVHGFDSATPPETKARNRGVADHKLMIGGLDVWDKAGGAVALQEHFVKIKKI